jgi:hypothetical protein
MTDDKIIMQVEVEGAEQEAHAIALLKEYGAEEVKTYGK